MKKLFCLFLVLVPIIAVSEVDYKSKLIGKKWKRPMWLMNNGEIVGIANYEYIEFGENNKYVLWYVSNSGVTEQTNVYEYKMVGNTIKARIISTDSRNQDNLPGRWFVIKIIIITGNKLVLRNEDTEMQNSYDFVKDDILQHN